MNLSDVEPPTDILSGPDSSCDTSGSTKPSSSENWEDSQVVNVSGEFEVSGSSSVSDIFAPLTSPPPKDGSDSDKTSDSSSPVFLGASWIRPTEEEDTDAFYEPSEEFIQEMMVDPYSPITSCVLAERREKRRQKRRRMDPGRPTHFGRTVIEYIELAEESETLQHMAVALYYDLFDLEERSKKMFMGYHNQPDERIVAIYEKVLAYYDTSNLAVTEIISQIRRALLTSNRFQVRQYTVREKIMAKMFPKK